MFPLSRCVEKSQSMTRAQALSSTLAAASRLSAMIHQPGKDQVYAKAMLVDQVSCRNQVLTR